MLLFGCLVFFWRLPHPKNGSILRLDDKMRPDGFTFGSEEASDAEPKSSTAFGNKPVISDGHFVCMGNILRFLVASKRFGIGFAYGSK